jgi:hypothetical protein
MSKDSLKEWFIRYKRNRDIIFKKIDTIVYDNNHILIKNKDNSEEIALIKEETKSIYDIIKSYEKTKNITIAILNKKEHINILLKEWDKLIEFIHLTVFFINPESLNEKKWLIKPAVHNKITDSSTLKTGIFSIAESVDLY